MTVIESVDTASTTLRAIKELQQVDLLQTPTLSFCWKLGITVPHCLTVLGYTGEAFSFVCFMLLNLIYLIKLYVRRFLCVFCVAKILTAETHRPTRRPVMLARVSQSLLSPGQSAYRSYNTDYM